MLSTDQITNIPPASCCHILPAFLWVAEFIIIEWKWDLAAKAQALNKKEINFDKRERQDSLKEKNSNCEILL